MIDIDGFIIYDHAGEGDYDVTEKAIQQALFERNARIGGGDVAPTTTTTTNQQVQAETFSKFSGSFTAKAHDVAGTAIVINTDTEKIL